MGASDSKASQGQVLSKNPPPQTNLPPEPPYPGPSAQYHFINTDVVIGCEYKASFTQTPMVTSNIDNYYPLLAAQYAQGFRLLSFYRIPGQVHQSGFMRVSYGFQGIFCRYPTAPRRERWQLRVEKSIMQLHQVYTGLISLSCQGSVVSNTSQLLDSIARNTQAGGRLICVELTGQEQSATMGMAMQGISPIMGVDLFFEVPESPGAAQYRYNCVCVPITVTVRMGLRPMPEVQCDWIGVLAAHLNQGWRLIEIFMDKTQGTRAHGFSGMSTMNSMWFFEKSASYLNDPRPVYEGTVVDFQVKIKQGFGGTQATANWESVIQDMGNKGWELACILETPEARFSGLATVYMTCKMFFQRPFIQPSQPGGPGLPSSPPPPYDMVVGGMWAGGGGGGGGGGGEPGGGGYGAAAAAAAPSAPSFPPSAPPPVGEGAGAGNPASAPPPIGFQVDAPPPPPEKMGY